MFQKRTEDRAKRFKLALVALLSTVVVIGFCLEARKYILGSTLVTVKRYAIVGDFDASYDKLFPRYYHATGMLTLPYDNIVEPFETWYAGERNMSRIDYYYGMYACCVACVIHLHYKFRRELLMIYLKFEKIIIHF